MIIEMGVILWLVFVFIVVVTISRKMVRWSDYEKWKWARKYANNRRK